MYGWMGEGGEDRWLDQWMEDRMSGYYGDIDALDPESRWHDEEDEEEDDWGSGAERFLPIEEAHNPAEWEGGE